ncbi:toxin, partial [Vibrio parahaemolyticus]
SGLGKNIFLNPKFLAAMALVVLSFGYLVYALIGMVSDSETTTAEGTQLHQTSQQSGVSTSQGQARPGQSGSPGSVMGSSGSGCTGSGCGNESYHDVGTVPAWFPLANSESIYVSAVERWHKATSIHVNVHFEVVTPRGVTYLDDGFLNKLGVKMEYLDDCLVQLSRGASNFYVTCSPYEQYAQRQEQDIELKPVGGLFSGDET